MEPTYLKYDNMGNVDVDASTAAFRADCEKHAVEARADLDSIAVNVAAVFDEFPNTKAIDLPTLASLTAVKMGAGANLSAVAERVKTYVRNAKSLYKIGKGRAGGVSRVTAATETPAS